MKEMHGNIRFHAFMFKIYMKTQNMYVFSYFLNFVLPFTPQYIIMVKGLDHTLQYLWYMYKCKRMCAHSPIPNFQFQVLPFQWSSSQK